MNEQQVGKVLSIAVRTKINGPMREMSEAVAQANAGLEGDVPVDPQRGVTFLAQQQWEQVTRELGADLPWHTRRANLLVDCPSLGELIGKTIRVGGVEIVINGETDPCSIMDLQHPGLREILIPDMRGGVYGRVIRGGAIKRGEMINIVAESPTAWEGSAE